MLPHRLLLAGGAPPQLQLAEQATKGAPALEVAQQFIERAKTSAGLHVTVGVLEKVYATGRKCAEGFKEAMKIRFDDFLPKWNYRAIPQA
jgi:hypothetical protein